MPVRVRTVYSSGPARGRDVLVDLVRPGFADVPIPGVVAFEMRCAGRGELVELVLTLRDVEVEVAAALLAADAEERLG